MLTHARRRDTFVPTILRLLAALFLAAALVLSLTPSLAPSALAEESPAAALDALAEESSAGTPNAASEEGSTTPASTLTDVAITLTAPVAGDTVDTAMASVDGGCSIETAWSEGDQEFSGTFEEGKTYTATFYVYAPDGSTFASPVAVTVNGAATTPAQINSDIPLTQAFICTASFEVAKPVEQIEVTEVVISVPSIDDKSKVDSTYVLIDYIKPTTQEFRIATTWSGSFFTDSAGIDRFIDGNIYEAEVTITLNSPYHFSKDVMLKTSNNSLLDRELYTVDDSTITAKLSVPCIKIGSIGRGCTIVSLFGDDAPETTRLRGFRDDVLTQSEVGRTLTDYYYQVSPSIVAFLNENPTLKPWARGAIGTLANLLS